MTIPSELRHDTPPDTRAAIIAHEVERLVAAAFGRTPDPAWGDAPGALRAASIDRVREIRDEKIDSPEALHAHDCQFLEAMGWQYGPVLKPEAMHIPTLVPWANLPDAYRRQLTAFYTIATQMLV